MENISGALSGDVQRILGSSFHESARNSREMTLSSFRRYARQLRSSLYAFTLPRNKSDCDLTVADNAVGLELGEMNWRLSRQRF